MGFKISQFKIGNISHRRVAAQPGAFQQQNQEFIWMFVEVKLFWPEQRDSARFTVL